MGEGERFVCHSDDKHLPERQLLVMHHFLSLSYKKSAIMCAVFHDHASCSFGPRRSLNWLNI